MDKISLNFAPITSDTPLQVGDLSPWVPVLYPGKWNGRDFTMKMMEEMCAGFSPTLQTCPIKLDHVEEGPAVANVDEVKIDTYKIKDRETKALFVRFRVTQEVLDAVRSGAYSMRSIEAWPPDHPSSPTPGSWWLKAVALLGAAAPAVPSLGPLKLSSEEPKMDEEKLKALETDKTALQAQLTVATEELKAKEAALGEMKAKLQAQELSARFDALKDVITPAQRVVLEPIALSIAGSAVKLSVDGKDQPLLDALFTMLSALPKHGLTDSLSVPSGKKSPHVEPDGDEYEKRVQKYMCDGKMTRSAAMFQASKDLEKKQLQTETEE